MKKMLSILIAISLVISMIPAALAETAGQDPVAETYTFKADGKGHVDLVKSEKSGEWTTPLGVSKTYYLNDTYMDFNSDASRKWKILDVTDVLLGHGASGSGNFQLRTEGYIQLKTPNVNIEFAFSLQSPAISGFYIPKVSGGKGITFTADSSDPFLVFMDNMNKYKDNEKNLKNYTDSENTISMPLDTHSGWENFTQTAKSAIYTKPGEEVMVALHASDNVGKTHKLKSITLNPIPNPELNIAVEGGTDGTITFETTDADKTATITSTTVSSKTDETIKNMTVSKNFITYESSDDSVATVDADGKITAGNAAGTAKIWAQSSDGKVKSNEITVTVKEPGVKVVYNLGAFLNTNKAKVESDGYKTISYDKTNGFYEFAALRYYGYYSWNQNAAEYTKPNSNMVIDTYGYGLKLYVKSSPWFALKIYVPKKGTYTPYAKYVKFNRSETYLDYFLIKVTNAPISETLADSNLTTSSPGYVGRKSCSAATQTTVNSEAFDGTVNLDAGEYYLVYKAYYPSGTDGIITAGDFILDGGINTVPIISSLTVNEDENRVTATAAKMSDNTAASDVTYTYSVADDDAHLASVDANGVVTGKANGTATIIATATKNGFSSSKSIEVEVTAPEAGEEVTNTNVSVAVQPENTEEGTVSWGGATIDEVKMGDTVSATATAKEGYVFRYWKNAAGQVLSDKAEESFVINTNSAITAVFDKVEEDAATVSVELFNANGMPFDNKNVNKGTTFADAIIGVGTPTYTGFGAFKHWSMYEDESKIDDNMLVKENTRAVAIFNAPTERYTVKVNDIAKYSDVLYGTEVTVSSTASDFSYWKFGEKIVSYNPNYKFTVWGDINLTEVTDGSVTKAPVAVLDEVDGNPLLIYSVPAGYTKIEAGILFGSTADISIYSVDGSRAVAARGTGQFTAQPKENAASAYARGYLIFKNNTTGDIRILYAE